MNASTALELEPAAALSGEIALPGSKSISNRILLLAALAAGTTRIHNLLDADDTRVMRRALAQLGVPTAESDGAVDVVGLAGPLRAAAPGADPAPQRFDLGLAGTAFRPLVAALTLSRGTFELDGVTRMRERPIGDLVDALRPLGADIDYLGEDGYPPLLIHGSGLSGGRTRIRGDVSSQFLTALLMAAPLAEAPVSIDIEGELVSRPYIDITLNLMQRFGVRVATEDYQHFAVPQQGYTSPGSYLVESDASSASYFLAAGAIAGPGMTVLGLGRNALQGDVAFTDVLTAMGARVTFGEDRIQVLPPVDGQLLGVDLDLNHIPDAAMTAAVLALFASGPTRIRNIANWRVKETDRLHAMATELRKLGARVDEAADAITIDPPTTLTTARIATYGDHRMAMCFSLVALAGIPITIEDPDCVNKTFPDYFQSFAALSRRTL